MRDHFHEGGHALDWGMNKVNMSLRLMCPKMSMWVLVEVGDGRSLLSRKLVVFIHCPNVSVPRL